jgi:formylglycine-generating enzyme required for sulfatase activity
MFTRRPALAVLSAALMLGACSGAAPARWIEPTTKMEFALLSAGEFVAGSPPFEPGHQDDEAQHQVRIPRPFYMATHEVTREQWSRVMSPNVAVATNETLLPVVNINWHDAQQFVDRLNGGTKWHFRLPSEAEWEYACRAGTTTAYSSGELLSTSEANYDGGDPLPGQAKGENRGRVMPVGSFAPNQWGLYDMHGNVWEWTNDAYDAERKVIRGGSWRFNADSARCALRYHHRPQDRGDSLGLRIVRDLLADENGR